MYLYEHQLLIYCVVSDIENETTPTKTKHMITLCIIRHIMLSFQNIEDILELCKGYFFYECLQTDCCQQFLRN